MLLYFAATPHAVSAALVVECDESGPEAPLTRDGPSSPEGPVPEAPNPREDPEAPVGGGEALASGPEAHGPDMTRDPPPGPLSKGAQIICP